MRPGDVFTAFYVSGSRKRATKNLSRTEAQTGFSSQRSGLLLVDDESITIDGTLD